MNFTKNSGLVKVWISLILQGTYELNDIPDNPKTNLKQVVEEVLKEIEQ